MNILLWIIFGGLAGWLASVFVGPGLGILGSIVVGIIGSFIGGWIADKVNFKEGQPGADRPTSIWSFLWAVVGSVVLLLIVSLVF